MTKKYCIWCESGSEPKDDYLWIHKTCLDKIISVSGNMEHVDKYLKGELPRISKDGNVLGYKTVEDFLVSMADFERRSRNLRKLVKAVREGTPLKPFEHQQV
jgi:hypothetical protein